jgi:hypothetical protein
MKKEPKTYNIKYLKKRPVEAIPGGAVIAAGADSAEVTIVTAVSSLNTVADSSSQNNSTCPRVVRFSNPEDKPGSVEPDEPSNATSMNEDDEDKRKKDDMSMGEIIRMVIVVLAVAVVIVVGFLLLFSILKKCQFL